VRGWAVVFRGPTFAADVVAASLTAAGLRVEVMTDTGHLWPGMIEDSRVFVPEEEAADARRLVDSAFPDKPTAAS
jgi:hypothetical protein